MRIRITLALLAIVAGTMAYPWQTTFDRWTLGIAVAVVVVSFAWWRGLFVTNMIGRRFAVFRRNQSKPKFRPSNQVTVLLRVDDPAGVGLALPLVAGYVDRFGVRCEKVRVTSRDVGDIRTTWIGMSLAANDNLAALAARSPELPLYDTAEIVGRRLADHLRETGLQAAIVDDAEAPLPETGREVWNGFRDDSGTVAAYGIRVDSGFGERLAQVWAQPVETWTALEFSGTAERPTVAAACAFRTPEPVRGVPVPGLVGQPGAHRPLLAAMDPRTVGRLGVASVPLHDGLLDQLDWLVWTDTAGSGAHALA